MTLALGIGATSAIFTVVRSVLLQPLPYAEPERRVMLWSRWVSFDKTWLSDLEILDYRRLATSLTAVAGWSSAQQNLTGDGEPHASAWASLPPTRSRYWARVRCSGAASRPTTTGPGRRP